MKKRFKKTGVTGHKQPNLTASEVAKRILEKSTKNANSVSP
jgi:hypothetical protein